jgi:ribosomal protein S18 acetylase RimI-like enzyme
MSSPPGTMAGFRNEGAPMKIRRATASDADDIARIINAAFEIEREFRRGERTSPSEVLTSISMEREIFLVAEDGGRLLGAVEVRVGGDAGYFGMLAVDASVRRGGIGRALVEAAEAHCRGAGCSVMTMSTGENRTELIPYYEKMGYRVTAVEPSTSSAFKYSIRVVSMEKRL